MKITFILPAIGLHQLAISNELYQQLGDDFCFIATQDMGIDEPGDVGAREGAGSEDHEVGVGCRGPTGIVEHLVHVARQVTDTWVYLCDCNAHAFLPR